MSPARVVPGDFALAKIEKEILRLAQRIEDEKRLAPDHVMGIAKDIATLGQARSAIRHAQEAVLYHPPTPTP